MEGVDTVLYRIHSKVLFFIKTLYLVFGIV